MNKPRIIYHLTTYEQWNKFKEQAAYESPTLRQEKFIHASTALQAEASANRYFESFTEIVLLTLDSKLLVEELKYEWAESVKDFFPHIYGPINKEAIVQVESISRTAPERYKIQPLKHYEIIVSGLVQGVGYRNFTLKKAKELQLTGTVQNLPTGQVLINASGDGYLLKRLSDWCYRGAPISKVEKVEVTVSDFKTYDDFRIVK